MFLCSFDICKNNIEIILFVVMSSCRFSIHTDIFFSSESMLNVLLYRLLCVFRFTTCDSLLMSSVNELLSLAVRPEEHNFILYIYKGRLISFRFVFSSKGARSILSVLTRRTVLVD